MRTICIKRNYVARAAMTLLLAMLTTATAWAASNPIKSCLDVCEAVGNYIHVSGWVYDTNYPSNSLSVSAEVWYQDYEHRVINQSIMADVARPDVNQAFNISGNHGFDAYFPVTNTGTYIVSLSSSGSVDGEGYWNYITPLNNSRVNVTIDPFPGNGTSSNPFIIRNKQDLKVFAINVKVGVNADKYYKLDDYFYCTMDWMIGTKDHPFKGHFDGNGGKLDVTLSGTETGIAPFHTVDGATIENLTVVGAIASEFENSTQNGYHGAGLVGTCSGTVTIRNCNIETYVECDDYSGGIVGHGGSGKLIMENCVFSGEIGWYKKFAGGLMGWCDNLTLVVKDCLFKGTFSPSAQSPGKCHPICLRWGDGKVSATVINTYYVNTVAPSNGLGNNAIHGADGTPVSEVQGGEWNRAVTAADGNTYYAKDNPVQNLPYEYGFENGMDGWDIVPVEGSLGIRMNDKNSGNYSFMFEECGYDQCLITPELISTSTIKMSFELKGVSGKNVNFQIGTSTTTNDLSAFNWVDALETPIPITGWSSIEVDISAGVKYIAIRYKANSSPLYLDDFSFTEPYPNPANLTLDEKTAHSATFSWEAPNATVKQYVYQYQKIGDGDRWAQGTTTNTTATISGLEAATEYKFRVKAVYGDGGSSAYMFVTFYTKSESMPLPYSDGFEGEFVWTPGSCDTGTGVKAEAKHSGSKGFEFIKTNHQQFIISPQFDGTQPMKVSFYYKNVDKSQPAFFIVGYSTYSDPDNIGFTTDESYVASSGEWELCETYCPLDTRYVVILWYGDDKKGGALYVDDFLFEVGEPCPWAGSGTVDAPYMITTTGELDALARKVNSGETYEGKYFKLGADLAYQHTTAWNDVNSTENNFTPIGYMRGDNDFVMFCGHFDGAGRTISGIRIYKDGNDENSRCQGLFGVIGENAEVKNLTLADTRVTGHWSTGSLAGLIYDSKNSSTITNCRVAADVAIHAVSNEANVHGGLVGHNYGTISNCISSATLTIADVAKGANTSTIFGGLVGGNGGSLKNNLVIGATIPATSDNEQGAIVGYNIPVEWLDGNISSSMEHNLYYNCNVAGVANAANVGCYDLSTYAISDLTKNDGAVFAIELTKAPANGTSGVDYIPYGGKFYAPANHTVTFTAEGYTSYYNSESAVTLPPGVKARIVVAVNADGSVTYETIADGDSGENTVPAGVAVLLTSYSVGQSHKAATYILNIGGDDNRTFAENLLHGSDEATTTTGGSTYYRMGYDENGQNKGWYWAANGGGAFESSAHEAWLAVPTQAADDTPLPLPGYDRDDVTTSIADRTNNAMPADEPWYTVDGRKADGKPATKSVYIRNGRKVVIK